MNGFKPTTARASSSSTCIRTLRDRIRSGGYIVETLKAALWGVGHARSFQEALLR